MLVPPAFGRRPAGRLPIASRMPSCPQRISLTMKKPMRTYRLLPLLVSNVIYVGTGEGYLRGNVFSGDGVYRSSDGGKSWANMGLHDTQHQAQRQPWIFTIIA